MNDRGWSNERRHSQGATFGFGLDPWFRISAASLLHMAQIIELFPEIVSSGPSDETILLPDETIFPLWRRHPETADGYQADNATAGNAGTQTGDSQMRTLSFILALAFVLAPSVAGLSDASLPGIGTFAYNGSPLATSAPQALVVVTN